jgi:hypothetical protein
LTRETLLRDGMSFKIRDRIRYEGQDVEKTGLKSGMEGEVVRCYPTSIEVYYFDLKRSLHHKEFDMKIYLKKMKR